MAIEPPTPSDVPTLHNKTERRAALQRYQILDTPPEEEFDRITSLAAKICDVPTSLITLIDEDRQWFKSCFGFDRRETPIDVSFCVHAVAQEEMVVVEDAREDPRFAENPLVTGPPHLRFYAGAPLTTPAGVSFGTLCIIDYEPRTFEAGKREVLERLANLVVSQLELRSAEAEVHHLVDENPQPMFVFSRHDQRNLKGNAAACDLYGYDAAELSDLTKSDLKAPAEAQPPLPHVAMHERSDGSRFTAHLRRRPVQYAGQPAELVVPRRIGAPTADQGDGIFFRTDRAGLVLSMSPQWESLTGRATGDVVGTALLDLVTPEDRSSAEDVISTVVDGETDSCRHEAEFETQHGHRPFEIHLQRLQVADESGADLVGRLIPIDREQAPPADHAESRSTSGGGTLDSSLDLPTFNYDFDRTDASAAEDGTSPSRSSGPPTERTVPDLTPEPFDLSVHLLDLIRSRSEHDQRESVDIRSSVPEEAVTVRLDTNVVDDIIGGLLDNALSNTEKGFVEVELESDEDEVHVRLTDTGSQVEERFMEVYMSATSGSTTLGLERIHQQAIHLNGSLTMENVEEGTRFNLTLPRSLTSTDSDEASILSSDGSPRGSSE